MLVVDIGGPPAAENRKRMPDLPDGADRLGDAGRFNGACEDVPGALIDKRAVVADKIELVCERSKMAGKVCILPAARGGESNAAVQQPAQDVGQFGRELFLAV